MSSPKPRQSKARQALLDSAKILLADNPGASFIEVAETAGIGRATLYRHFPTKEDLIRTLTLEAIEKTDDAAKTILASPISAQQKIHQLLDAMIELGDSYYFLTRLSEVNDSEIITHLERQNKGLEKLIETAQQDGSINPALPISWVTHVFNGLTYSAWTAIATDELNEAEVKTLTRQAFDHGLAVTK